MAAHSRRLPCPGGLAALPRLWNLDDVRPGGVYLAGQRPRFTSVSVALQKQPDHGPPLSPPVIARLGVRRRWLVAASQTHSVLLAAEWAHAEARQVSEP